jgi:hypothetical protein
MNKNNLQKDVRKTLKLNGCYLGKNIKESGKIYYQTWNKDNVVVVYILNSHNDYRSKQLAVYKFVAKMLIDNGYAISMQYPCYINITYKNEMNKI